MRSYTKNKKYKDKKYLEWMHLQPCMITGSLHNLTAHHVRNFGSIKDDRRTVPLVRHLHQLPWKISGQPCVEEGKKKFEEYWHVDLEAAIVKYNLLYEQEQKSENEDE